MPRMQMDQKEDQIIPWRIGPQRAIKCDVASCLLTDVGRKVGEYEGGELSVCISHALPSDIHYQNEDTMPDRASRKHYISSHNHRKIFGRRHLLRLTSTANLIQEITSLPNCDYKYRHKYKYRHTNCDYQYKHTKRSAVCRQMLQQISTDCSLEMNMLQQPVINYIIL